MAVWIVWRVCRMTGSTQKLPKAQEEAFRYAVEQMQVGRDGGRIRGEDIRQLLPEQFHIEYSLDGMYHLLKRLGMVWISACSANSKADLLAQLEFKKTSIKVQAILPAGVASKQTDI
jgi:transposase